MTMTHLVERPSWQCVVDGEPWPCEFARKELATAMTDDDLPLHLARLMIVAADELGLVHNPARLYRRFLRWTSDADGACGRCGRTGHFALPVLPVRLFPCDTR